MGERWTEACSGCFEPGENGSLDHLYPWDERAGCRVGAGCSECGFTGKRRRHLRRSTKGEAK
jgi:hypothetical protein